MRRTSHLALHRWGLLAVILAFAFSLVTPGGTWQTKATTIARAQSAGWGLYVYGPDEFTVETGEADSFADDLDFGCYGNYGNQWGQGSYASKGNGRWASIDQDGTIRGGCYIMEGDVKDGRLIVGTISGKYSPSTDTVSNFRIESSETITNIVDGQTSWWTGSMVIENASGGKDKNSTDQFQYAVNGKFTVNEKTNDGYNSDKTGSVTVDLGIYPIGPSIQLDRKEAPRFGAIKISGSGFKKQAAGAKVLFNGEEIYRVNVDYQGNLIIGTGGSDLWIWVPDDAPLGINKIWVQVSDTGEKSAEVELNVTTVSREKLTANFDEIVKQYLATIPRNEAWYARFSPTGGWIWGGYGRNSVNAVQTLGAAFLWLPTAILTLGQYQNELWPSNKFVCSWYQREVLGFLDGIRFDNNPERRALMDGFDYGPFNSGPLDVAAGAHYYVALWPHGPALDPTLITAGFPTTYDTGGITFDPWPKQAPEIFPLKAGTADWAEPSIYSARWTTASRYIYSLPRPEPPSIGYYKGKYPVTGSVYYSNEKLARDYRTLVGIGVEPPKMISTHSPVTLEFVDASGNKAGLGPDGLPYSDIPDLEMIAIPKPEGGYEWYAAMPEGEISVTITGIADGSYQLVTKTAGQPVQEYPSVTTKADVKDQIILDDQPVPQPLHTADGRSLEPAAVAPVMDASPSTSPEKSVPGKAGNSMLRMALYGGIGLACLCGVGLFLVGGIFILRRGRSHAQPKSNRLSSAHCLVFVQGATQSPPVSLGPGSLLIGRNVVNGLAINDPKISRQHARIDFANGGWQVTDLQSANGIYINGVRIQQKMLFTGDLIKVGDTILRFE